MSSNLHGVKDHDFAMWAFGDTWVEYLLWDKDGVDLIDAWNSLHGDLLKLQCDDLIFESMAQMKDMYHEHLESSVAIGDTANAYQPAVESVQSPKEKTQQKEANG